MNPAGGGDKLETRQASLAGLGRGQIHVHQISLDPSQEPLGTVPAAFQLQARSLDAGERRRAAGFVHDLHRRRFVAARWSLRTVLGGYLNLTPADVPLTVTPMGKPVLQPPHADLQFNLSHTEGRALLAVTLGRPLGLDVETVTPLPDVLGVAARVCTERELAELQSAPPSCRTAMFYRLWTRREAALKALGTGLGGPPGEVEVGGGPSRTAWLRAFGSTPRSVARALATDLGVEPGLQAALVVCDGAARPLHVFSFTGTGPGPGRRS